jgi:putative nucleotidyltransferase with HDIG domain
VEKMKKHILFVDDDPKVLQGLRRMLLGMRTEWEMHFVHSGEEALTYLSAQRVDAIVTDMNMPGMDGTELLDRVKANYPDTVRILLTAQPNDAVMIKAARSAHQCIAKPCNAEFLQSTLSHACGHHHMPVQDPLRKLVSQLDSLPSLPTLYTRIMKAAEDPECSVHQVGKLIEEDVGISVKIIQLTNSAFYGVPHRVSRPSEAAVFLGMDTVKTLVLGIGLFSGFDKSKVSPRDIEQIYNHSVKTGAIAQKIAKAEEMGKRNVEEVFVAGLLHDLGKLVIAHNLPESGQKVLSLSREKNIPLATAETEIFGANHAQIGAYLFELWGLPDTLVEAVAYHHQPRLCPNLHFGTLCVVHVANALEHVPSQSFAPGEPFPGIDTAYLTELGLVNRVPEWKNMMNEE